MKRLLINIAFSAIAVCSPLLSEAQSKQQKQVFDAVLNVYDDELKSDPSNFNVWFRRATLFYGNNQYSRALSDIDNAIKYTPANEADLLSQEYALRSNIYSMLDKPQLALDDIKSAITHDPTSYALIYQKANLELQLGNLADAKEDFRKLGRMRNRSVESLIGLSQVAVGERNFGQAKEYIDQAVSFVANDPDIYLRRAEILKTLDDNNSAADDIIVALSLEQNGSKAMAALFDFSKTNYNSVIAALSRAINEAPDNGLFYYVRASIEQAHYHYVAAINDYRTILDKGLYKFPGINAALAECYYYLCDYDAATKEINYAISATSSPRPDYTLTLSRIQLAQNEAAKALGTILSDAGSTDLNVSVPALSQKALCLVALNQFVEASTAYGELIMDQPHNPEYLINRAWTIIQTKSKGDYKSFLNNAVALQFEADDIYSMKGFALNLLGKNDEAAQWIDKIIKSNPVDVDGRLHYLAACLYSQLGNYEKALDCMTISLDKGYANLYDWQQFNAGNINVDPMRKNPEFEKLIKSYDYIFNAQL